MKVQQKAQAARFAAESDERQKSMRFEACGTHGDSAQRNAVRRPSAAASLLVRPPAPIRAADESVLGLQP